MSHTYMKPPRPILNGGLYTGEPFSEGAPWANVPVSPDVAYLIHKNLSTSKPPKAATTQYPGGIREGNNYQVMPGVRYIPEYGILANDHPHGVTCDGGEINKCRFSKYSYW